ncbi:MULTISPECIES: hypothetical protein [Streptomyces]|uniref:hypothetical protein n=1 Tax=Streptomyces TaxID=1883 RepID=UPI00142EAEFB|nr:hypothetical protein [Streptomyces prasinus]
MQPGPHAGVGPLGRAAPLLSPLDITIDIPTTGADTPARTWRAATALTHPRTAGP